MDLASFKTTLRDLTSYDDYLDLLKDLTRREKGCIIQNLVLDTSAVVLPQRWKYLVETITRDECRRMNEAMDLKAYGFWKDRLWNILRQEYTGYEKILSDKSRPPIAQSFLDRNDHPAYRPPHNPYIVEPTLRRSGRIRRSTLRGIDDNSSEHDDKPSQYVDKVDSPILISESKSKNAQSQAGDSQHDSNGRATSPSAIKKLRQRRKTGQTSAHFPTPIVKKKRLPAGTSCIAFPPTTASRFGIVQEALWDDPYKLLIAVMFLNKTKGETAMPIFRSLMARYPTPDDLARADVSEISAMIYHLGLQTQRAKKLINFAKIWVADPPQLGRRHRSRDYPCHGDGRALKPDAIEPDATLCAGALEVAHLPGCGPYAWDSWRIFCRDVLRGVATGYDGEGSGGCGFEPEWKRVLPLDKELRAFLRWMWLRQGWVWDPISGKSEAADPEVLRRAAEARTEWVVPEIVGEGSGDAAVLLVDDSGGVENIGYHR
ncbi:hypothetical protein ANO11243_005410 [Dothideomycetidae sp. 11243]|nr:hypothetical protein ANO11243_005410 [fungal sp. No.11243]